MLVSSPMKCFLCQKHQILLKYIFVIVAVSDAIADLFESVRMIFAAGEKERTEGSAGFILVTSFTMSKVHSFLVSEGSAGASMCAELEATIFPKGGKVIGTTTNTSRKSSVAGNSPGVRLILIRR
ncbi:hypothetical protein DCAR_0727386 [Daucus carota subsp. sativus]|uniref:Uncharacterized protein n=1 Tax=Daucus carota subsp. sativus TaxID=79200 RepID=A0A161ZIK4_DAUCS|nr:hypothetical protein DCAR_0727386 [Daucus carota subsp. sativus]